MQRRPWPARPASRALERAIRARSTWLAVIAAIAVYLSSVGHMTLVAHATCAHGEVVHGSEPHSAAELDSQGHGESAALVASSDEDHGHCHRSGFMPALASVQPVCAPVTLLAPDLLPSSVRCSSERRSVSALILAPKSSPPV